MVRCAGIKQNIVAVIIGGGPDCRLGGGILGGVVKVRGRLVLVDVVHHVGLFNGRFGAGGVLTVG
jgi:hypothetical protein